MKRNCREKKGKTSNGKQGTLQSCLNACQELESWVENGLVWSGLVWFYFSTRTAHFALRVAASCGTCSQQASQGEALVLPEITLP